MTQDLSTAIPLRVVLSAVALSLFQRAHDIRARANQPSRQRPDPAEQARVTASRAAQADRLHRAAIAVQRLMHSGEYARAATLSPQLAALLMGHAAGWDDPIGIIQQAIACHKGPATERALQSLWTILEQSRKA